jgi:hypothetical protein
MPNHLLPPSSTLDRRKSEDDRGDFGLEEMEASSVPRKLRSGAAMTRCISRSDSERVLLHDYMWG